MDYVARYLLIAVVAGSHLAINIFIGVMLEYPSRDWLLFWGTLVCLEVTFLGLWTVLGDGSILIRVPLHALFGFLLALPFLLVAEAGGTVACLACVLASTSVAALLRIKGIRLATGQPDEDEPWRFTITDMLLSTSAVALLLLVGRLVKYQLPALPPVSYAQVALAGLIMLVIPGICYAVLLATMAWAVMAEGRVRLSRIVLACLAFCLVNAGLVDLATAGSGESHLLLKAVLILIHWHLMLGSLFLIRAAGFRWLRIGDLATVAEPVIQEPLLPS